MKNVSDSNDFAVFWPFIKKSIPYVLDGTGDADNDIDAIWDSGHLLVENWQPKQHFGQSHHLCWPGQHMLQLSSIRRNICGKNQRYFCGIILVTVHLQGHFFFFKFWVHFQDKCFEVSKLPAFLVFWGGRMFWCFSRIFKVNVFMFPNYWSFEAGECFDVLVAFSR